MASRDQTRREARRQRDSVDRAEVRRRVCSRWRVRSVSRGEGLARVS